MPEFLTTAEFGRWANAHDERMQDLLLTTKGQARDITSMKVDIGSLKAIHATEDRHTNQRKGLIGGAIAAMAGAIAGALTGRF